MTQNVRLYERAGYKVDREEEASLYLGVFVHMNEHLDDDTGRICTCTPAWPEASCPLRREIPERGPATGPPAPVSGTPTSLTVPVRPLKPTYEP